MERALAEGAPYLILDGKAVDTGRCQEKTVSRKGKTIDLWCHPGCIPANAVTAHIVGGSAYMIRSFGSYAAAPSDAPCRTRRETLDAGLRADGRSSRSSGALVAPRGVMCWKPSRGGRHEHLQGN